MALSLRLTSWFSRGRTQGQNPPDPRRTEDPITLALRQIDLGENVSVVADLSITSDPLPGDAQTCCIMGYAAVSKSEYTDADSWFMHALRMAPDSAEAHYGTALVRRHSMQIAEALAHLERAIELKSDFAEALAEQGDLLTEQAKYEDAADAFNLALAFKPDLYRACLGYGKFLRTMGRPREAGQYLDHALQQVPRSSEAWFELALARNNLGNTAGAVAAYERAIEVNPNLTSAYVNLGLIYLAQLGEPARAESLFRRAAVISPDMVEVQTNLGLALHEQQRSAEALRHFDALVRSNPGCMEYRWHRGTIHLALENYTAGWLDYEARKERGERSSRRFSPLPEWDGTPLGERGLLVYAEQGLGDEIMFASCLPDLASIAQRCVLDCDARLVHLFRRSFPHLTVHGATRGGQVAWLERYPDLAMQCAIGSLPRFLRPSRQSFADGTAYLEPEPRTVERWKNVFANRSRRLNVGIAWRGGTVKTRQELRSTALTDWTSIFRNPNFRFFSLQQGGAAELQHIATHFGVAVDDLADAGTNMDELAAVVSALDLIITVQGTLLHLAGALGRPTWVLLSRSPEWRYLVHGDRMPWYSSVRLFRQERQNEWGSVFGCVDRALRELSAS